MRSQRDFVAKDLRTPKYKMRVVPLVKIYNRKKDKKQYMRELKYV